MAGTHPLGLERPLRKGAYGGDIREVVINGTTLVDCRKELHSLNADEGVYLVPRAFTVVRAFSDKFDTLKLTLQHGLERTLTNAAARALKVDETYYYALRYFRNTNGWESGFRILLHY